MAVSKVSNKSAPSQTSQPKSQTPSQPKTSSAPSSPPGAPKKPNPPGSSAPPKTKEADTKANEKKDPFKKEFEKNVWKAEKETTRSKQLTGGSTDTKGTTETKDSKLSKAPVSATLWKGPEVKAKDQVAHVEGSFGDDKSKVQGQGELNVGQVQANGSTKAEFDPKKGTVNVSASGNASANVVQGKGTLKTDFGTTLKGEGSLGAETNGKAELKIDPRDGDAQVDLHGDAFIGGKVGGSVTQQVGPVELGLNGHFKAGLGGNFDAEFGIDDGKAKTKLNIGGALGVGGDIGFEMTVDVPAALKYAGDGANTIAQGSSKALNDLGKATADTLKPVADGANTIAQGSSKALNDLGKATADTLKPVADGASTMANEVNKALQGLGQAFGSLFQ